MKNKADWSPEDACPRREEVPIFSRFRITYLKIVQGR
jgi:hypothetical protein